MRVRFTAGQRKLREREKHERDAEIARLQAEGKNLEEIGEELDVDATTVARNLQNSKSGKMQVEPENDAELAIVADEAETEEAELETPETNDSPADEEPDIPQSEPPAVEEEPASSEPETEPAPPEEIPEDILNTARAVMGAFAETRPDDYVARLEASGSEQMTITGRLAVQRAGARVAHFRSGNVLMAGVDDLVSRGECRYFH